MNTQRIRVVFGVNDFLVGGMQRQLIEQLKRYDRARFDMSVITLFTFAGQVTMYDEIPEWVKVHRVEFSGWSDVRSWAKLHRLLKELSPDVVVSSLFFSNTVFRMLKPLCGYVSIAREHNTYFDKPFLQRLLDRLLAPISYRIVAVSRTVADFTAHQERIPRKKFEVISNGIDVHAAAVRIGSEPAVPSLKKELGFSEHDRVLLAVARMMPQKNHQLMITGFARFQTTHPEYRLALVGDGPLRESLERQVDHTGLKDVVQFFGNRTDVWPFYRIADALISTSTMEGLSNAMLEALASGVPLVATRTAGTDELLEEGVNGYFVADDSTESVVRALEQIHERDAEQFAQAAQDAASRFSIEHTVQAYEALFSKSVVTP